MTMSSTTSIRVDLSSTTEQSGDDLDTAASRLINSSLSLARSSQEDEESTASDIDVEPDPRTTLQQSKRLAQHAVFEQFLTADAVLEDAQIAVDTMAEPFQEAAPRIIDTVRDYQQELFERATSENIIAVLDTGSGKTLIACLLIKYILTQEVLNRAARQQARVPIFLANSVHLVKQQARVLFSNLGIKPIEFCGNDGVEAWKRRVYWNDIIAEGTPVVCTPAILQQCLDGAILDILQISLLVFDEAHHAKKNHPYCKIIRSHYLTCAEGQRPRIFGMTASPIDSKGSVETNARELEGLLHSRIVTTSDMSLLAFAPKPKDVIWRYTRPVACFETEFSRNMHAKSHFYKEAHRAFLFSRKAVTELGSWCADRAWSHVFGHSDYEREGFMRRYESSKEFSQCQTLTEREANIQSLQDASMLLQHYNMNGPPPSQTNLSPKVRRVYAEILNQFSARPDTRAIIFVDQRLTAHVLNDCFTQLKIPNLRPGVLLGNSTETPSLKKQREILDHFRIGIVNLVFATSVADEGIDIQQCNLCVRFDLYRSPIQYMQSRGRARMADSIYAHVIEDGNKQHESEVDYAKSSEAYIKEFCQSLPPNRLLGRGTKLQRLMTQDASNKSFRTAAGAVCDFGNSLLVLARFTASLHHIDIPDRETYEEHIDEDNKQYRYLVRLPKSPEIGLIGAKGEWKQNKQLAKRSAALNCCYLLRQRGKLDDALQSVFRRVKPLNLNARIAVSEAKSAYPTVVKPSLWLQGLGQTPQIVYATIISFEPEQPLERSLEDIVFLTRVPLPDFPRFPVFLEQNIRTEVMTTRIDGTFQVSSNQLQDLTRYTLDGVFRDVFNKVYELDHRSVSYFLAPFNKLCPDNPSKLADIVDFDAASQISLGRLRYSPGDSLNGLWTHRFICDPRSGKHWYFSGDIAYGVGIFDPVPDSVPSMSHKRRNNIIDFSDSTWKATKQKLKASAYDISQSIMHAEIVLIRRNFLEPGTEKVCRKITCMIAPQPLEVSRLTPGAAASYIVWPSIIHRFEAYMIALEGFGKIDIGPVPTELALQAFTKDGDGESADENAEIPAHRAMGRNYERLEFIGDSLLKMMTTIMVFLRTKCDEEGMHCRRMSLLSNRNLFEVSTEKHQLYQYAQTVAFNRDTWYPENLLLLKGKGAHTVPQPVKHNARKQDLGKKTIADISEAIIGAAVLTNQHLPNATKFDMGIKAITALVNSEDHAISSWSEIFPLYSAPEWSLRKDDVQANKLADRVLSVTGYKFRHPRLLRSAFTHSSDSNATVPDLQRLEFLGDAVLDWVSVFWLFESNPTRNPQWLTEHKMPMVSNGFLAALAVVLGFDKFMYCTTMRLFADITAYAKQVRAITCTPSGDRLGREDIPRDFWKNLTSPPKALSDLVESYIGALLVDSNFDYTEIEKFFEDHVLWYFEDITMYDDYVSRQPTSYLYKKMGDEFKCHDFRVVWSEISSSSSDELVAAGVILHNQCIASGKGTSARYAKVRACKKALEILEGLSVEDFRTKYDCDCTRRGGGQSGNNGE